MSRSTCASRSGRAYQPRRVTSLAPTHDTRRDEQTQIFCHKRSRDLLTSAHNYSRAGASDVLTAHTPLGVSSMSRAHPLRNLIASRTHRTCVTLVVENHDDDTATRSANVPIPTHPGCVPRRQDLLPLVRQRTPKADDRPCDPGRADAGARRPVTDGCRELGRGLRLMQRSTRRDHHQRSTRQDDTQQGRSRLQPNRATIPRLVTPDLSVTADLDPETRRRGLCPEAGGGESFPSAILDPETRRRDLSPSHTRSSVAVFLVGRSRPRNTVRKILQVTRKNDDRDRLICAKQH